MKYVITKLFHHDGKGAFKTATAILSLEGGQMREVSGYVGSLRHDGEHVTELRGPEGAALNITVAQGTTLHITPLLS
jgi:hypothetical protein